MSHQNYPIFKTYRNSYCVYSVIIVVLKPACIQVVVLTEPKHELGTSHMLAIRKNHEQTFNKSTSQDNNIIITQFEGSWRNEEAFKSTRSRQLILLFYLHKIYSGSLKFSQNNMNYLQTSGP